jgi:predicted GIY-YIG superfamily endonuclease
MWCVYGVKYDGIWRYIGKTGDLEKREKNHNYMCFKKLGDKLFYREIRSRGYEDIELIKLKEFNCEEDARRWECLLILEDYFGKGDLWQMIPSISDKPRGRKK